MSAHNVLLQWRKKTTTLIAAAKWQSQPERREKKVFLVRSRCSADRIVRCLPSLTLQIFLWEQNLEQFHMDLFRFRCYLASLQGGELPNPKRLLAVASRPTKLAMGRLGIFSVSSFHALVNGLRSHFDSNIHF